MTPFPNIRAVARAARHVTRCLPPGLVVSPTTKCLPKLGRVRSKRARPPFPRSDEAAGSIWRSSSLRRQLASRLARAWSWFRCHVLGGAFRRLVIELVSSPKLPAGFRSKDSAGSFPPKGKGRMTNSRQVAPQQQHSLTNVQVPTVPPSVHDDRELDVDAFLNSLIAKHVPLREDGPMSEMSIYGVAWRRE